MTIADDIAKLGDYHADDVTNAVAEAYDQLYIFYGSALVEGADLAWDKIAKTFSIHIVDRMQLQRRAGRDPTIEVPQLVPSIILRLIKELKATASVNVNPSLKMDMEYTPPDANHGEHWRDSTR